MLVRMWSDGVVFTLFVGMGIGEIDFICLS